LKETTNHGGTFLRTDKKSGDKPHTRQKGSGGKSSESPAPLPDPVPGGVEKKDEHVPEVHTEEHAHNIAGRPFWSGSIAIGLVNVPVRLHVMVRDKSFSFRLLHRGDGQPLRYDRVCSKDGIVVPWAETMKGYEVRKGEFVVFSPEDLKAALPESDRKIRIGKFVEYQSLDPVYFDSSYILIPDRSEEAYSLLLTALTELGRAAAGSITLRTKEYPVVVHPYGGGLVLTTLRHGDEVTLPRDLEPLSSLPAPKPAELALAKRIITELSGEFSLADYHDRYREAILKLIEKKLTGEKLVRIEPQPEEAKEIMLALQETLATLSKH